LLVAPEDRVVVVRGRVGGEGAGEVVPPVEVRTDRLCVERRPVLEPHALAELERPDLAPVRGPPGRRELRDDDRRPVLQTDETLGDLVDHAKRLAVRDDRAVERGRLRGRTEHERVARRTGAGGGRQRHRGHRTCDAYRAEQHFQPFAHRSPLSKASPHPWPGEAAAQYDRETAKRLLCRTRVRDGPNPMPGEGYAGSEGGRRDAAAR